MVDGHRGAARILDGHEVPVCGALYHRRVRRVAHQPCCATSVRVQCGCIGTGVVTHRGGYGIRASRPNSSAGPRWVFIWKSCTRGGEVASQEVEGFGRGSGGAVVADLEALRFYRL